MSMLSVIKNAAFARSLTVALMVGVGAVVFGYLGNTALEFYRLRKVMAGLEAEQTRVTQGLKQQAADAEAAAAKRLEATQKDYARQLLASKVKLDSLAAELARVRARANQAVHDVEALPLPALQGEIVRLFGPSPGEAEPKIILSEAGARQAVGCMVKLDSCRAEVDVLGRQGNEFQDALRSARETVQSHGLTIVDLKRGLELSKQHEIALQDEFNRKLKVGQPTRTEKILGALKYVGVGIVIGAMVVR